MGKITVSDVAKALCIDEQTVRSMADQGLLPFMAPTNRKEDKRRASYVVFPHLFQLYVTGYGDGSTMAKELFLLGSAMKKGELIT